MAGLKNVADGQPVQDGAVRLFHIPGPLPRTGLDLLVAHINGAGLEDKAEVLALSRADAAEPEQVAEALKALAEAGAPEPFVISAATGEGMEAMLDALLQRLGPEERQPDDAAAEKDWSPL